MESFFIRNSNDIIHAWLSFTRKEVEIALQEIDSSQFIIYNTFVLNNEIYSLDMWVENARIKKKRMIWA